jgi:uncharacterized membrane protein YedE/YeeE
MPTELTLLSSLIGGVLIGLAAGVLLYKNGQIAGISGIVSSLLKQPSLISWRFWFVAGLCVSPWVLMPLITTDPQGMSLFGLSLSLPQSPAMTSGSVLLSIVGGLLVGLGARIGNGCTSGHGVCGLARLSKRSFAAVGTFMLTGFITVSIIRHLF